MIGDEGKIGRGRVKMLLIKFYIVFLDYVFLIWKNIC